MHYALNTRRTIVLGSAEAPSASATYSPLDKKWEGLSSASRWLSGWHRIRVMCRATSVGANVPCVNITEKGNETDMDFFFARSGRS